MILNTVLNFLEIGKNSIIIYFQIELSSQKSMYKAIITFTKETHVNINFKTHLKSFFGRVHVHYFLFILGGTRDFKCII